MKIDVVLGLQWGDEGKGKIVDLLAKKYPVVCRFQGGGNAGHSIHFGKQSFVLHLIPSGVFRKNTINLIGNGVVLDPVIFKKECEALKKLGIDATQNVIISKKTHLILPTHRLLDAANEAAKGKEKIGSTLNGIGPAYTDKTGRCGIRVGDILERDFKKRYYTLKLKHEALLKQLDYKCDTNTNEKEWLNACAYLKKFRIVDGEYELNALLKRRRVLAEGAQGSMLDIDFGSYPFVTSSSTVCAGVCTGLGVAPSAIGKVYGIFKAYCTRVGSGPFPTELNDATGEHLRQKGNEFGATTGRPRRTGWLDLPALKYAIMISGVTELIMTKADILTGFKKIKVATAYIVDDKTEGGKIKETDQIPFSSDCTVKPLYKEFKGWDQNISKVRNFKELPQELKDYIKFIERELSVPIKIISVGADRNAIIEVKS